MAGELRFVGVDQAKDFPPGVPVLTLRIVANGAYHYHVENFFQPEQWINYIDSQRLQFARLPQERTP